MKRTMARAHAMQLIYESEMGGEGGEETRLHLLCVEPNEEEADYMERMFKGVSENLAQIDAQISSNLRGWTIERLSRVDLAILRLGAYELSLGEVSPSVAINEAVQLANDYSTEKAGPFINGVLGSILRAKTE